MEDNNATGEKPFVEEVEVRGHIIDSLLLPKILDCITTAGGTFRIKDIAVGHERVDPSFARIDVMLSEDGPQVLEANAIPGLTDTSLLPMACEAAGIGGPVEIRVATFNIAMGLERAGQMRKALESGNDPRLQKVARILQEFGQLRQVIGRAVLVTGNAMNLWVGSGVHRGP